MVSRLRTPGDDGRRMAIVFTMMEVADEDDE